MSFAAYKFCVVKRFLSDNGLSYAAAKRNFPLEDTACPVSREAMANAKTRLYALVNKV